MATKYWVAKNPNAQIDDAGAQALAAQVASAEMTVGAEAGEAITVSVQFKNGAGDDMSAACAVMIYFAADDAGQTAASSANLSVAAGTDGHVQEVVDSATQNNYLCTSEADGDLDVVVTDASGGATTNYMVIVLPNGSLAISGAITFVA
jgi:hypothetical protein